jgi:prophage maintenance system killer protein
METGIGGTIKFSDDGLELDVLLDSGHDTVWLTQEQMCTLFGRDQSVISRHISNSFEELELNEESNMQKLHIANADRLVSFYDLDVIISVGYRVKSPEGVTFRKWANNILKDYLVTGVVYNHKKLNALGKMHQLITTLQTQCERDEVGINKADAFDVLSRYSEALELLDDYDHHRLITNYDGRAELSSITPEECETVIEILKYGNPSPLFGKSISNKFESIIMNTYQTFFGDELYPSFEDKASNLLVQISKTHPALDGNKRIGCAIFLYYLNKNNALFNIHGDKVIDDHFLTAITLMIANSDPKDHDLMTGFVKDMLIYYGMVQTKDNFVSQEVENDR